MTGPLAADDGCEGSSGKWLAVVDLRHVLVGEVKARINDDVEVEAAHIFRDISSH